MKLPILIIDDEPVILGALSSLLEGDFKVHTASSGAEGLFAFERYKFSLVLTDLTMPGIDGVETVKKIREKNNDVKVIIMTATSSYDYAVRCADLNVQGYIQKPFDNDELVNKIKKVLGIEDFNVLKDRWGEEYDVKAKQLSGMVRNIISFVQENDENVVTREETAFIHDISPDHLSRLFRKECGLPFKEYVNLHKIHKSKEHLLNEKGMTVKHIAKSVGIPNTNYFCRLFKKYTGSSPNEFRKR